MNRRTSTAGAIATILIFACGQLNIDLPPDVAAAATWLLIACAQRKRRGIRRRGAKPAS